MPPLNIHPPDPESPKGMAFVLGAGMVDPRPGGHPNQPMALIQSWEPTSELWWDIGLRWHPELATKWLTGGGQFAVATVTKEKPDYSEEFDLNRAAAEVLEYIGQENPEYIEMLKKIRDAGTPEEKAEVEKTLEGDIQKLVTLMKYMKGD